MTREKLIDQAVRESMSRQTMRRLYWGLQEAALRGDEGVSPGWRYAGLDTNYPGRVRAIRKRYRELWHEKWLAKKYHA